MFAKRFITVFEASCACSALIADMVEPPKGGYTNYVMNNRSGNKNRDAANNKLFNILYEYRSIDRHAPFPIQKLQRIGLE